MLGVDGGFCNLLAAELGKKVLCQHCLAHRLQLILKNVNSGNQPICRNCLLLEKYNNVLAGYYSNSGKKKRHLKRFCQGNYSSMWTARILLAFLTSNELFIEVKQAIGVKPLSTLKEIPLLSNFQLNLNWGFSLGSSHRIVWCFCQDNGFEKFMLHKTFEVRWVQSHASANQKVYDNFYSLVLHLRRIKSDRHFRKGQRTNALTPQVSWKAQKV